MSRERFLAKYGSEKHLDDMFDKIPNFGRRFSDSIAQNQFATKEHLEKMPEPHTYDGRESLATHPNLPDSHRTEMLKGYFANKVLQRPETTKDHLNEFISHGLSKWSDKVVNSVISHPSVDSDMLHNIIDNNPGEVRLVINNSKKLDRSHVEKILKDERPALRCAALDHHLSNLDDHLHAAYHDPVPMVRIHALLHPDFPNEDLRKIASTDKFTVGMAAKDRLAQYGEHL